MGPGRSPFIAGSTTSPLPGFPKTHIAIPKPYRVACPSGSRSRRSARYLAARCFRLGEGVPRTNHRTGRRERGVRLYKNVDVKVANISSGPLVGLLVPLPMLFDGRTVTGYFACMVQMAILTAGCLMGITCLVLLIEATYARLEVPAVQPSMTKTKTG